MITFKSENLKFMNAFIQVKDHPIFPQLFTYSNMENKRTPKIYLLQISKDALEKKMPLIYFI